MTARHVGWLAAISATLAICAQAHAQQSEDTQPSKATQLSKAAMSDDPTITIATNDPAMTAAMRTARASLPYFLALAERPKPDQTDFMLKVGLPYVGGVEYIWMKPFRREGMEFVGEVSNTPKYFPGLKLGQSAVFEEDNIVDWAYRKNGVPQGHYTTCVLISRLGPRERAHYATSYGLRCDGK